MTSPSLSFTVWHGTPAEWIDLVRAVEHSCACPWQGAGAPVCPTHRMLLEDQRALDGLLFARRIRQRLLREELEPPRPARSRSWTVRPRRR